MQILGLSGKNYETKYICEISHSELEKFLNQYYDKLKKLAPGDTVDLGKGYDFLKDIESAIKENQNFLKANKKIISTIMDGFSFLKK